MRGERFLFESEDGMLGISGKKKQKKNVHLTPPF